MPDGLAGVVATLNIYVPLQGTNWNFKSKSQRDQRTVASYPPQSNINPWYVLKYLQNWTEMKSMIITFPKILKLIKGKSWIFGCLRKCKFSLIGSSIMPPDFSKFMWSLGRITASHLSFNFLACPRGPPGFYINKISGKKPNSLDRHCRIIHLDACWLMGVSCV